MDDLKDEISTSAENNLKLNLLVLSTYFFILVTIIGIKDIQILKGSGLVKIPLLDISLPLMVCCYFIPLFAFLLHLYFLINLRGHFRLMEEWLEKASVLNLGRVRMAPSLFNFYLTEKDPSVKILIHLLVFISSIILPLGIQMICALKFVKFQSFYITGFHLVIFIFEVYFVFVFRKVVLFDFSIDHSLKVVYGIFGMILLTACISISAVFIELIWMVGFNKYKAFPFAIHLEIPGANLELNSANEKIVIKDRNLYYLRFYGGKMSNLKFSNVNFYGSQFKHVDIDNVEFINCARLGSFQFSKISNSRFYSSSFTNGSFKYSTLSDVSFNKVLFSGEIIDFSSCTFSRSNFRDSRSSVAEVLVEIIRLDSMSRNSFPFLLK